MNVTVDPALAADPKMAEGIARATALLRNTVKEHDSPVTAEWRAVKDNPAEVELALSDGYGGSGTGQILRSDILTGKDRWVLTDLRHIFHNLIDWRVTFHLSRAREAMREVEENEHAQN